MSESKPFSARLTVRPADVKDAHTSHLTGFMDRMLYPGHHDNEQKQQEQYAQQEQHKPQPEVTPQERAQPQPRFKDGERERVEDYVDEERKLLGHI
ncbi:hypothetical protein CNMCM5793_004203 [Aspergillus hiratsukae]|uniref:Uncharacterized protein n=1 Tax=Aspergillus hiratsukae TaxID=1194566 RepID=A0A8H6PF06_9EURO|nr:hypothetical protein CNMCM5793_004203 [Aspergillus hiratsukae]